MFLGKYLIDNNKVSEEEVVESLCLQMESTPSLLRIACEQNILTNAEAIDLVDLAIGSKLSFIEAFRKIKPSNVDKISSIYVTQQESRKSLGYFFNEINALSISDFETLLTEYFAKHSPKEESSSSETDISPIALAALKELGDVGNADEIAALEKKVNPSSSELVEKDTSEQTKGKDIQFVIAFDDEKYFEMKNMAELLKSHTSLECIEELEKFFHKMLGTSRFCSLNLMEKFCSEVEDYIKIIKKKIDKKEDCSASLPHVLRSVELLRKMRMVIYQTAREVEAFSRPKLKNEYLELKKDFTDSLNIK